MSQERDAGEATGPGPWTTARLVLRRLQPEDADRMYAYRSDPDVRRFQGWEPASRHQVADFIAVQQVARIDVPGTWVQLAIAERATDELIGDVGLHFLDEDGQQVELGITLERSRQGRGYAAEALRAALDHVFADLGKHRAIASVDPRNRAAIALVERVGMRREAHHVESLWFKGAWEDDLVYAVLRREWPTHP